MSDHDEFEDRDDPKSPATSEERTAAASLLRAFERGTVEAMHADGSLDDELRFAALLQHASDESVLAPDRLEAILEDVFEGARMPTAPVRVPWWKKILAPTTGIALAATCAALLFSGPPDAMRLPAPGEALLDAQMSAAVGGGVEELEDQMGAYRESVLGAMEERYR